MGLALTGTNGAARTSGSEHMTFHSSLSHSVWAVGDVQPGRNCGMFLSWAAGAWRSLSMCGICGCVYMYMHFVCVYLCVLSYVSVCIFVSVHMFIYISMCVFCICLVSQVSVYVSACLVCA